jgi:hypothetical protein
MNIIGVAGSVNSSSLMMIGSAANDTFSGFNGSLWFDSTAVNFSSIGAVLLNPNGGSDILSVAGGTLALAAGPVGGGYVRRTFSTLSIAPGAELYVVPPSVYHTDRQVLVVPANVNISGKLDLTTNDLIVNNGSFTAINNTIATGVNLFTSVTTLATSGGTANTSLGVMLNGSPNYYPTFDGVPVSRTAVIVKWTFAGDTNLNGRVDSDDSPKLNTGLTGWSNGDYNYDGVINSLDTAIYNRNLTAQGNTFLSP